MKMSVLHRTSSLCSASIVALGLLHAAPALANPQGGTVAAGRATMSESGATLNIHQHSDKAVIDWRSFDIDVGEHTQFHQPSSSATALNRVNSTDPSRIAGKLSANGNVILVNPNGVFFEGTSQVDVNGLIATTADIDNTDFMAGKLDFNKPGNPNAAVVNAGTITAKEAGLVGLVAPNVENHGVIHAKLGKVQLASGDKFMADLYGDGLIKVRVSDEVASQLVSNTGSITAEGGTIAITAAAGKDIVHSLVTIEGELKAPTIEKKGGKVIIGNALVKKTKIAGKVTANSIQVRGDDIRLTNSAKLEAPAESWPVPQAKPAISVGGEYLGGDGIGNAQTVTIDTGATLKAGDSKNKGAIIVWSDDVTRFDGYAEADFVETSGKRILKVGDNARVNTHGGLWLLDPQDFTIADSGGDISTATLQTNLASGDVAILSSGGGTAGSGDIIIEDALGWSANTLTLTAARDVLVKDVVTVSGTGALTVNTATTNGADTGISGGALKMDLDGSGFNGRVDYSSSGALTINGNTYTIITSLGAEGSTTTTDLQGMKGNLAGYYALGANIDASATTGWNAGAGWDPVESFTGDFNGLGHTVDGLFINRTAEAATGLFGLASGSNIANIGATNVAITAKNSTGGLIGDLRESSILLNSYSTGTVNAPTGGKVGGLVGFQYNAAEIHNSFSLVNTSGHSEVGGLVGSSSGAASITNSFSSGNVTSNNNDVGGLVGRQDGGLISYSYATGDVNGSDQRGGGLVGYALGGINISYSYATGDVDTTNGITGGLVGWLNASTVSNSYTTGAVSGHTQVGGLIGQHRNSDVVNSYASGWITGNFNTGGLSGMYVGTNTMTNSFWNTETSGQATSAAGTGKTTSEMMDFDTFNDAGWDITDSGGGSTVWRIYEGQTTPLLASFLTDLTLTATDTRTYDGTAYTGGAVTGSGFKSGESAADLLGAVAYGGTSQGAINAGTYTLTASGYYSGQQGYDIAFTDGTLTINKAALTVTADDASRSEGSGNPALTISYSGFVTGEDETLLDTAPTATTTADSSSAAGAYAIIAAGGVDNNYSFSYVDGTLTVNSLPPPPPPPPPSPAPAPTTPVSNMPATEPEMALPDIEPVTVATDSEPSVITETDIAAPNMNTANAIIIPSSVEYMMQNASKLQPDNRFVLGKPQLANRIKQKGFIGRLVTIQPMLLRKLGLTEENLPF